MDGTVSQGCLDLLLVPATRADLKRCGWLVGGNWQATELECEGAINIKCCDFHCHHILTH